MNLDLNDVRDGLYLSTAVLADLNELRVHLHCDSNDAIEAALRAAVRNIRTTERPTWFFEDPDVA